MGLSFRLSCGADVHGRPWPLRQFQEHEAAGMTAQQIRLAFAHHELNAEQQTTVGVVRRTITDTTVTIAKLVPNCRERSTFISLMQQAFLASCHFSVSVQKPGPPWITLLEWGANVRPPDGAATPFTSLARKGEGRGGGRYTTASAGYSHSRQGPRGDRPPPQPRPGVPSGSTTR